MDGSFRTVGAVVAGRFTAEIRSPPRNDVRDVAVGEVFLIGDVAKPSGVERGCDAFGLEAHDQRTINHLGCADGEVGRHAGGIHDSFTGCEVNAAAVDGVLSKPAIEGVILQAIWPTQRHERAIDGGRLNAGERVLIKVRGERCLLCRLGQQTEVYGCRARWSSVKDLCNFGVAAGSRVFKRRGALAVADGGVSTCLQESRDDVLIGLGPVAKEDCLH